MRIGLHVVDFSFPGGPPTLGRDLARIAWAAEEAGVDRISVMDHVWQIRGIGPPEHEMLEAYTTLGFLAAHTSRAKLLALVTAATYRDPGMLAKHVTALDVLSGGRAMLGIGAGWNEDEARGLGLPFPGRGERFERLEETLQICLQMWSEDETPYEGKHYRLARPLNSPQALSRPHPPILIGGGGEQKTCGSSPAMPTRATCSPAQTWRTSSTCCASTARARGAITTRSRRPSSSASTWVRRARRSSRPSSGCGVWPTSASRSRTGGWWDSPTSAPSRSSASGSSRRSPTGDWAGRAGARLTGRWSSPCGSGRPGVRRAR